MSHCRNRAVVDKTLSVRCAIENCEWAKISAVGSALPRETATMKGSGEKMGEWWSTASESTKVAIVKKTGTRLLATKKEPTIWTTRKIASLTEKNSAQAISMAVPRKRTVIVFSYLDSIRIASGTLRGTLRESRSKKSPTTTDTSVLSSISRPADNKSVTRSSQGVKWSQAAKMP